jgi:hypothetical protein
VGVDVVFALVGAVLEVVLVYMYLNFSVWSHDDWHCLERWFA